MANLILLAGIPGAGKSTFAETFFRWHYAIVSSDAIRERLAGSLVGAHQHDVKPWDAFYTEIHDRLRLDVDTVADATFLTKRHRLRARELADQTESQLHLILFKDWVTANLRNNARGEDAKVPREAMDGLMDCYFNTLAEIVQETYDTVTKIERFD